MNNQITLIGNVGADPVATTFTDSDNKVVKFSIAVRDIFSREESPEPMWIDVDAWNGLGERVMKTIKRGREVVVFGRLSIVQYEKEIDGVRVLMKKPVVKLTSFHLSGGRRDSSKPTDEKPAAKRRRSAA